MIRQERIKGTISFKVGDFSAKSNMRNRSYKTGGSCVKISGKGAKMQRAESARVNADIINARNAERWAACEKRNNRKAARKAKREARKLN